MAMGVVICKQQKEFLLMKPIFDKGRILNRENYYTSS